MRQGQVKVSMVGLLFLVALIGQLASSAWGQPVPGDISAKIHFRLLELLDHPLPLPPQDKGLVRIDEQGRVQVYIHADPATQGLLDHITALGGEVDGQGLGVIQAWVPVQALGSLAALPEVRYIRPPDYAQSNVGSVTTQGDVILGASAGRQQFGVNGTGVRVGVISFGIKGLEQSIASGDLPPTSFFCRSPSLVVTQRPSGCLAGEILILTTGGITGTPFPSGANMASDPEGTAMLEIVRDLAPGAELWFTKSSTSLDLASAASFLAANVDIVVSDIILPGFFPDGQNTAARHVAQVMANPSNRARAFIQAVGNYADKHYSGLYTASGVSDGLGTYHLFAANSQTTGPTGPLAFDRFTVPPFTTATVYLSWNDPAGASTNDYDLVVFDCTTGLIYGQSIQVQNGFQEPAEAVSFPNFSAAPFPVCYKIQNFLNMAAPRILNVVIDGIAPVLTGCLPSPAQHMFNTLSMSLLAPADTPGDLIAVGAVPQCSPSQIEVFSSRGPTFDGRSKPDVVAADGVSVTGAGGFPTPFFGTSAAAPHVAAIAALLLQCDPALTSQELRDVLTQNAVDLGGPGFDFTFGFGRVDALNALANAGGCGGPIKARLQTPAPGSTLASATVTFTWSKGSGAVEYWLDVGTTPGGSNLLHQSQGTNLSGTVGGLPTTGQPVYVRLWSRFTGVWQQFNDYTYTACSSGCGGGGGSAKAVLQTPAPGTVLAGATATFTWSAGSGVLEYWLDIGTTPGGSNLLHQSQGPSLSGMVSGLPTTGQQVYVRLWSRFTGVWQQFNDYTYTAATAVTSQSLPVRLTIVAPSEAVDLGSQIVFIGELNGDTVPDFAISAPNSMWE
jgi:Subtilase family